MIAWFARNHVAANLLMVAILAAGITTIWKRVTIERFPEIEQRSISITVPFRGATPEEIEQTISTRVEESIYDLEGIKRLVSSSREGSSSVRIEVEENYDVKELLDKVKSRVDALNTLPVEAEKPIIQQSEWNRETISVVVSGELAEQQLREYAELIQEEMTSIPGLSQVVASGVRSYEISIEVNQNLLNEYGLTLQQIGNAINASSLDLSAGQVKSEQGEILLRLKGQSYTQQEFYQIPVLTAADGTRILLGDIAIIRDGFEDERVNTRFDNVPSIELEVYRVGSQSAIEVAQLVKDYVKAKQDAVPAGLSLSIWRDNTKGLNARLNTLIWSAAQGGVLVILLLSLFLRPSIALWVSLGIPIAFAGGMALMPELGASLNLISLFAFILVLGIVVDDAIVTGENIYNHLKRGDSPMDAAINGTKEVAVPVTFGVITTMVAFIPILFMPGGWGAWYYQLPLIVIPVLFFSLVESKLILPAHIAHTKVKPDSAKQNPILRFQRRFAHGFEDTILRFYKPTLDFALRHWQITVAVAVGLMLIIYTAVSTGVTRYTPFPRIQSEVARATLVMPSGTPFEITDNYVERMTTAAQKLQQKHIDPETNKSIITHIFSLSGASGGSGAARSNVGRVMFEIISPEERSLEITSGQLVGEWRRLIGPLPGVETLNFRAEFGRNRDPIDVELNGSDIQKLNAAAADVKAMLFEVEGLFDIADSFSRGKQEIQFELKPQAETLGITLSQLARQVRSAFFGIEVQRIQRGRDDVRVMLRLSKEERSSLDGLNNLIISTPAGAQVPLNQVATLSFGKSPTGITRIDRRRTLNITADLDKQTANVGAIRALIVENTNEILKAYPGVNFSLEGEAREEEELIGSLGVSILFVVFIIYGLLAIAFKDYLKPIIVMSIIPLSAVMAVVGHWFMGLSLSMMSLLGMLALMGVVVNDSLVLVDYINTQRRNGISRKEAVLNAGVRRLRPVMLTSLTTFVGLIPIIFDKSTQAQFLIPMGVSLGFGILLSTFITLIMVPMLYYRPRVLIMYMASVLALIAFHYRDWLGQFLGIF